MKKFKVLIIALLIISGYGCDGVLDIEPAQSLSVNEALSDYESLETALIGAYDRMQAVAYYGRDFVIDSEIRANNVYLSINNSNRFVNEYIYQLNAQATATNFWNQSYAIILSVNNIINNIDLAQDATVAERNQVLGEALAIRALVYHDLTRNFCAPYSESNSPNDGVPIILEAQISQPERDALTAVYAQIEADLGQARTLMSNAGGPFRFTSNAAIALQARVALYKGDWAAAEGFASEVIGTGSYSLYDGTDLATFWSTAGTGEEIFTLQRLPDETLGSDNLGQIYNPQGYGDIRVTTDIMDSYEAGDSRIGLYYQHTDGEFYVGKFLGELGVPGLTSNKIFRLAEMYLIRAEARANQSNNTGAIADINIIRSRAQLPAANPTAVLDEVYAERNRELTFEGHRSFDLWRTGRDMVRIQANTGLEVSAPDFIAGDSFLRVFPIPQRELDANPNISQAPGY